MGLLSWFYGSKDHDGKESPLAGQSGTNWATENPPLGQPDMNGATEVRGPDPQVELTILKLGYGDKETLAGYCPVSNKMEPCTWRILPASGSNDVPKIRIEF